MEWPNERQRSTFDHAIKMSRGKKETNMPTFIIPLLYLVIIFRDPRLLCCKHCPSWFFNRLQSKLFPPGANLQCLLCKLAFSYFLSRRKFLCYCAHCDKKQFLSNISALSAVYLLLGKNQLFVNFMFFYNLFEISCCLFCILDEISAVYLHSARNWN